jgi:hypothetical protein
LKLAGAAAGGDLHGRRLLALGADDRLARVGVEPVAHQRVDLLG